jgi:hypothetical protein
MPDDTPQSKFTVEAVDWSDVGYQIAHGLVKLLAEVKAGDAVVATLSKKEGAVLALAFDWLVDLAVKLGEGMHALEAPFLPVIAGFVAPIVQGLFGAEVAEGTFARRLAQGGGHAAATAIVEGFLRAIEGDRAGELTPGPEGSARVAAAAVAASLESTFNAIVPEILSDLAPFEIGHFKELTELPEGIIRALGVGRLVRRAVGPLVNVCAATPMQWHVNKKYRPTLLGAGEVVRQALRGKWTRAEADEELARQGYSPKRIDALFNAGQKFFSPGDVRTFYAREEWTGEQAEQHLRDQGYDADAAHDALRLEGLRRFEQLEAAEAAAIVSAYVAGDIDRPTLVAALEASVRPAAERALLTELADVRRAVNVKQLSLGQVEAMVKSGVLAFVDYREAARREGYLEDAVAALELQLRWEMDRVKAIEDHRRELAEARAEEKRARDAAIAARKAAVEADRALTRRGSEADLERAVVRGLIPIARLEEVYAARYDADTVETFVALVEEQRAAYVAEQQKRDEAAKRGARKSLDAGAAEAAFHAGLLTADELRARLQSMGFDAGDADLLARTAAARQADLDAAAAKRAAAEAAAKARSIDLGRFEQLVRRGVRTFAQYAALLEQLGFDEAAVAGMTELLELKVADDDKARQVRAAAAAVHDAHGLTLEQIRRAVILGIRTIDDYGRYLVENRFTTDAQLVLLDELRADVAEADAARRRRDTAPQGVQAPGLPLSAVRKAAQLGIIPPADYVARLEAAGWSDDDIAIDLDLLVHEIADAQATRARTAAAAPASSAAGLTLADLERAVKAGEATIADYVAGAITAGYTSADAEAKAAILERERSTYAAARTRRNDLGLELAGQGLDLPALERQVQAGDLEVVEYVAQLEAWGSDEAEAELLGALLVFTLASKAKGG